ncbi:serine hydrolase [Dysgonomonas sp. Marseille-P4677]|uniref:glycoside hydrolase family 3 N-terminal domain-containing protein n=1 Tax=Dysgonomonas sp. Marseille-P4677 TaxID=2364790 RepID=UPI001914C4CD|nr:glycoside hydrolase family 3 N-terminal domain-containing protein [Dysgonomonas sp. Marseille-P4677]MBK5719614.1 serine hydrolase [Dysgonomonas sp. Marseille-P4677]
MKFKYIPAIIVMSATVCLQGIALEKKKVTPGIYKTANTTEMNHWVDSVFNQMSVDERIGQLFMPVVAGDNTDANKNRILSFLSNQHIGGILFSKGTPIDQAELTNMAQNASKVPLMISLDGEWGLSMRLANTTRFPRNMMLGAIQNDSLLYYYGKEVARQCKLMGIHVNFAPTLDVNSNPSNPVIGNRSFGEDPEKVAKLGIMYSKGLEAGGIMAVAKHFPGHGDTSTDSHKVLPTIAHHRDRLDEIELKPFNEYIKNGLSGMMIAHLYIPTLDEKKQPSSLSEAVTTTLLQKELGFSGLIFTDGLQMKGVSQESDYCIRALQAGNDILLGPLNTIKEYESVKKAVQDSILSESLINEKCKKVLAYKYILGVNKTTPIDTKELTHLLNTSQSEWINRELHKNAITVLKDDQKIIPLKELDKRKIAAISVGESSNNTFQNTLKMYADITCFNVSNGDELLKIKKVLEPFNTIIVSVHSNKGNANAAIQNIGQGKEVIMAFFIVPYRMSSYSASIKTADGVVLAYENSELAQDYTAQAIFGGYKTDGKIPVTIKGLFKEGKGIETKKTRLSYEMPETVDISSGRLNNIDTIAEEGIKAEAYPGCQILIAKDGIVIYNRSFGTYEYKGNQKVTNSDIYDLASMTKATSTVPAIMKLYDEEKLRLSTPISSYVSPLKGTPKSQITVREALLHETGLPSFIPYYMDAIDKSSYDGKLFNGYETSLYSAQFDDNTWARTDFKYKPNLVSNTAKAGFIPLADGLYINKSYNDTIISAIANSKLRKRKIYLYSCLNFMLLKEVVEKVSKEDLNSFVQENFFNKLGAVTTTYNPLKKFDKSRIVPTEKDDFLRKQLLQGYVHDEGAAFMGGISGNAGLFSNANDLAKLYQMWLNKGTYGGEEYLSNKTCQLFFNTKSATSRRGLGFDKPEMRTNKSSPTSASAPASVFGHTGFTGTCFWIDPDNNLIFIFLSNRINDKRTHKTLMSLNIRSRIQEEIYKAMRKGDALQSESTNINANINIDTDDDDQTEIE